MRHIKVAVKYPLSAYDEAMCLKPSPSLWLAVMYLSRAITLPAFVAAATMAGVKGDATEWLRDFWNANGLAPSLLAAVMLYALCRRVPTASNAERWIWAHGRSFLATSAALDLALSLLPLLKPDAKNDIPIASLATAIGDAGLLVYVAFAARLRDTFAEFPSAPEALK